MGTLTHLRMTDHMPVLKERLKGNFFVVAGPVIVDSWRNCYCTLCCVVYYVCGAAGSFTQTCLHIMWNASGFELRNRRPLRNALRFCNGKRRRNKHLLFSLLQPLFFANLSVYTVWVKTGIYLIFLISLRLNQHTVLVRPSCQAVALVFIIACL